MHEPKIYDISIDEFRPVTQADADQYMIFVQAYGVMAGCQQLLAKCMRDIARGTLKLEDFRAALKPFQALNGGNWPQDPTRL